MNILLAAAKAAKQTAEARRNTENRFAEELKKRTLYIGEIKDFGAYLDEQGVKCYEHSVESPVGSFILYSARDAQGKLIIASRFEWSADVSKDSIALEIKGGHLNVTTEEFDQMLAEIDKDNEPAEEKDDCSCPVCELRRALTK